MTKLYCNGQGWGVLPVMLFHASLKTFSGGFVSVDVFFVISGLITTIILFELEARNFALIVIL